MPFSEKDVTRASMIIVLALLGVLVFLIIRPVFLSIVGGLILAFIFFPVYRIVVRVVRNKTVSAAIVTILVLAVLILSLWFLMPIMSQQVFQVFQLSQSLDINGLIATLFPTASEQFTAQINTAINSAFSKVASVILDALISFLVDFAVVALHILLMAFVFFFTLRDHEKLGNFVSGLSPLNKIQERKLVNQFKEITSSLVYGQIVIGFIQGILTGLGLLVFGVPNALVLTVLAIIFGIIPLIGPGIVYLPVGIYLLVSGNNPIVAMLFLAYNLLFVSTIDNFLRSHWISKKTQTSQAIVLIGMVGGLFIFGILGLILGPLILAYFITFLNAYKDKTLSSLFTQEAS